MKKNYVIMMFCLLFTLTACTQNKLNESMEDDNTENSDIELNSSIDTLALTYTNNEYYIEQEEANIVYLEIEEDIYTLYDEISYKVVNNSEDSIYVVMIPNLEKEADGEWIEVPTVGVGFCGTPDEIVSQHNGILPLSWYEDSLKEGNYRLSFKIVDFNNYEPIAVISDTFMLSETGVLMTVKEGSNNSTGITLVWENSSEHEYDTSEHYILEKQSGEEWENVDTTTQNYGFRDVAYPLGARQIAEMNVNWEWLYGELEAGKYRITKYFSYIREPGDYDSYSISAEFKVD